MEHHGRGHAGRLIFVPSGHEREWKPSEPSIASCTVLSLATADDDPGGLLSTPTATKPLPP